MLYNVNKEDVEPPPHTHFLFSQLKLHVSILIAAKLAGPHVTVSVTGEVTLRGKKRVVGVCPIFSLKPLPVLTGFCAKRMFKQIAFVLI